MNQNTGQSISDADKARKLREEAEHLEYRQQVRCRVQQLMELSKDPYYDQFLSQLKKDLESGRATPAQVDREAERSYRQYRQRMSQLAASVEQHPVQSMVPPPVQPEQERPAQPHERPVSTKKTMEFRVGVHLFGLIGALFILTAFVIFSYNFLDGLGQGICLYAAAIVLILLSEILLRKKIPPFASVITGIGIGGLYVANIANYYALHTINEITAMAITLLIALGAILLSRRANSGAIRLVSFFGCYICLFFMRGFAGELNLLLAGGIVLIVNISGIFIKTENNQKLPDSIHIWMNTAFTAVFVSFAWAVEIQAIYLSLFVIMSFIFTEVLCLCRCKQKNTLIFVFSAIANGISILLLFLIGANGPGAEGNAMLSLFQHWMAEVLILAIAAVVYMLWDKEDGRKWAQAYYVISVIMLLGSFSDHYKWEMIISALVAFTAVKILASVKEIRVLDCVISICFVVMGIGHLADWHCWIFAAALLLSVFRIKQKHIFHEIVITVGLLLIWWSWFGAAGIQYRYNVSQALILPVSMLILLVLFLLFNHLPMLKGKNQKAYNITAAVFMAICYILAGVYEEWMYIAWMMLLGAVAVIIIFRKRYEMSIPRKHLLLASVLAYLSLAADSGAPVISSMLLMCIGLVCVWTSSKQRDPKVERVCGLVLAGFVCLKLLVYDFREVEMLYRAILFLAVGVIALLISFFYILLEKREEREKQKTDMLPHEEEQV